MAKGRDRVPNKMKKLHQPKYPANGNMINLRYRFRKIEDAHFALLRSGALRNLPIVKISGLSVYAARCHWRVKNRGVVPTTGLEPINRVFSPLPAIASFSVFIAHKVTGLFNDCKH